MKSNQSNFIIRLQAGKEDALEYIVDLYLPLIKGMVHKVLGPLHQEEMIGECVNDIFLSIWQNAQKFRGNDPIAFKKWICAIAKYRAIDYYRRGVKKKELSLEHIKIPLPLSMEMEHEDDLMELLSQLEPTDQKIFMMRYLMDYNTEEIAERLTMTKSAVNNRIHRGKKKLKNEISSKDGRYLYEGHL
ncbi:sigma-70 family RNA polymerase sigma factor [Robertmurraya massiliosenegalensis]|uniref:sigma-70 family RNA polymerase sigma factor n=1 Tax=Robertmurraya massiliosenegalensis TaxID=1287657 RepID=UPI0002FE7BAC|nr:sigma-70 family RNA polymerase sigma factor [Robertmurraya massiliosenegalensis]